MFEISTRIQSHTRGQTKYVTMFLVHLHRLGFSLPVVERDIELFSFLFSTRACKHLQEVEVRVVDLFVRAQLAVVHALFNSIPQVLV